MLAFERPWTRLPINAQSIDWSNPLTRGLRCFVAPGLLASNDLTGRHQIEPVGTFSERITPVGIGALINQTTYCNILDDSDLFSNNLSVVAVSNQIEAPISSFNTAFVNAKTSSFNDAQGWHFQIDNTDLRFFASGSSSVGAAAPSSLGVHVYGATYAAGATRLFIDGTFRSSGSVGTSISEPTTPLRIGDSAWKNDRNAEIVLVAIWTRTLSDAEQIKIHANPFALLRPRRIYVPQAAASAPTLSDLQAVSITASSVQGTYDYAF